MNFYKKVKFIVFGVMLAISLLYTDIEALHFLEKLEWYAILGLLLLLLNFMESFLEKKITKHKIAVQLKENDIFNVAMWTTIGLIYFFTNWGNDEVFDLISFNRLIGIYFILLGFTNIKRKIYLEKKRIISYNSMPVKMKYNDLQLFEVTQNNITFKSEKDEWSFEAKSLTEDQVKAINDFVHNKMSVSELQSSS